MSTTVSEFQRIVDDWRNCGFFSVTNELLSFDKEFDITGQCLKKFAQKAVGYKVLPYSIIANNASNLKYVVVFVMISG